MDHPALRRFTREMDAMTANVTCRERVAETTASLLQQLLEAPEFLDRRHCRSDPDHYRQHLVHVGQGGRYSLISLVWRPGQSTPIHDHRCWCVVGVLEGEEHEERFQLRTSHDGEWLRPTGHASYGPGAVCTLVPPDEDIHRVRNASGQTTISLHVYGTDISIHDTSINRVFDLPIRRGSAGTRVSWRDVDAASVDPASSPAETSR